MDIDELRQIFGLSRRTINYFVTRGVIPPPSPPRGNYARYAPECIPAIRAYLAIKHNNAILKDAIATAREEGISLVEYVRRREQAIRRHGLGVA